MASSPPAIGLRWLLNLRAIFRCELLHSSRRLEAEADHSEIKCRCQLPTAGTIPFSGWLCVMDYTRIDIGLIILTTIAVAIFLGYLAFGPDELIPSSVQ